MANPKQKLMGLAAGAALVAACASTGTQNAAIYTPLSGTTQLSYTPTGQEGVGLDQVTFSVDGGTPIPGTNTGSGPITANFDTSTVSPGIHTVTVTASGTVIFEASIFVAGGGTPTNPPAQ